MSDFIKYQIKYNKPHYIVYYKKDEVSDWQRVACTNYFLIAKHIINEHIKYKKKEKEKIYYFTEDGVSVNE